MLIRQMQLGKQGITENFINSLKNQFKNSQVMKISVLKSATRDREEVTKIKEELLKKLNSRPHSVIGKNNLSSVKSLGKNFTARIIGFTIILRKWRKAREEEV